ncbi:MAG: threonine/serine dehydratase [candidate division NC10 bacterium]|nr:threonine/serine dehydratase [candidate division NC10 bacterium]
MITVEDVRMAAARIAPHVRRTPLVSARALKDNPYPDGELLLKLECLQATGSFKARGATNKFLSLTEEEVQRGIITASGGNHGLATAYAGWLGKTKATVYLPESASPEKAKKLADWGARVLFKGSVWDEANREALAVAEREGLTYFHPFADPVVIAGQGTTALEILEQEPDVDDFVVAIGGGGLISGIALTVKALRPAARIIGVEPTGAPTLSASLTAGRVVELPAITTSVATLAAMRTEPINLQIVQRCVEDIVLVTDDDMREAARWLWFEMGLATDLSGAAAVAALRAGKFRPAPGRRVCALVCGAGSDALAGR